jgi:hypothetical protein
VNVSIIGQFTVSAEGNKGAGNQDNQSKDNQSKDNQSKPADSAIEVYVLSEPAFTVWQNGYATSSVYESGRVSQGTMQAELPAGAGIYYLVFSNKFAPRTAKNVNASVLVRYKSWLPESLQKMKNHFWNWLGL